MDLMMDKSAAIMTLFEQKAMLKGHEKINHLCVETAFEAMPSWTDSKISV